MLATLGVSGADAFEGPCRIDSGSLNYGMVSSLDPGWQPGVGEVVVRCQNGQAAHRSFSFAIALAHEQPLENTTDPRAPTLKMRFFEDPGYRMRWGGGGRQQEGKVVAMRVEGMSESTLRVPVYGMIFVPKDVTAGEYVQTVDISIRYRE